MLRTIASRSRFGVGSVRVTSMYSVITGRRVNLLSLGPSLYSVTRSTASARYDSGARNFSGCSSGVTGVIQVQRRRPELQRAMFAIPCLHPASRARARPRSATEVWQDHKVLSDALRHRFDAGARSVQQALCALRSFDDALRTAASSCECHRDSLLRSRRHRRAVPRCVLGDGKAVQEGH